MTGESSPRCCCNGRKYDETDPIALTAVNTGMIVIFLFILVYSKDFITNTYVACRKFF